ncbi:hypothetical protein OA173_06315 [Candidatus Pelagibacter sp.]|nr:hypothetical protein [Candidatus Pelagibacter sp.]
MSEKKKIDIIFLIQPQERGFKDIDHYLPFFYFLSKIDNLNYSAKGIIFDSKTNFSKYMDQKFSFLADLKNIKLEFLYEENLLDKIKQIPLFKNNFKFVNRVINKLFKSISKIKNNKIEWSKKLGQEFLLSNSPLIFTMNNKSEELRIISEIKKQNIRAKWVALPHGTLLCENNMVLETHLDKKEQEDNDDIHEKIDYLIRTSKRDKEILVSKGFDKDKIMVIGSPRYCDEWLKIKSKFELDGNTVPINNEYQIRVLFLIPKKHVNIFSEELIRNIDFVSKYEEIELILLSYENHLPKLPGYVTSRKNIRQYSISQKFSTSKLIDWSDIVLHAGTGVIFESFVKEKITVFPRYLCCNTLISDKYKAGFNLSNRDELRNFLNASVSSLQSMKSNYKESCKFNDKKYLDEFVYAGTESIQDNITKTMLHICNNF